MNKIPTPFISLQSDFGFKRAFGTERFRSAMLLFLDALLGDEIKVTDVRFQDKKVLPSSETGKRIGYDVYCTMDVPPDKSGMKPHHLIKTDSGKSITHHFILEMQNVYEPHFEDRMLYYAAKSLADQGKRGYMDKLDKNSAPYLEGGYEKLFEAAESSHMAAEDVVLYSQSLERLNAYRAGIDYAAEQSWASGLEKGRAEGLLEGRAEAEIEIARNLLKAGIPLEVVSDTTCLSIEQLDKIL